MATAFKGWESFAEYAKQRKPDALLERAVSLTKGREAALDMGAGGLNETAALLESSFEKIVVLDADPGIVKRAGTLEEQERLDVVVARFENYAFPVNFFDLINARFSLPFVPPSSFDGVFQRMVASLKRDGVFAGQLFGTNDYRSAREDMSFHSREDVQRLCSHLEVLVVNEEEYDGPTYKEGLRHWHVWQILARAR